MLPLAIKQPPKQETNRSAHPCHVETQSETAKHHANFVPQNVAKQNPKKGPNVTSETLLYKLKLCNCLPLPAAACCLLLPAAACSCLLLPAAGCCLLLPAAACCCLLLHAAGRSCLLPAAAFCWCCYWWLLLLLLWCCCGAAAIKQPPKQETNSQTPFSKHIRNSKTPPNFVPKT